MIMVSALAVALIGAVESTGGTAQAEATGRQLLFFNHAYGVFDRETADAIEHSTYLRDFANFQVRTTTGTGGQQWTGRYLMGHETYLELFGVGDVPGQDGTLGSGGMGLGTERDGDIEAMTARLPAEGVADPVEFLQTRDFGDGVPVPWFDAILTTETYDAFGAWAMEYRPEYFADPRGNTEPAAYPGDVGRERYLPDAYQDHLMRDVTSIRMGVTQRDLDATVPLLRAGGLTVRTVPTGVIATRGGTTIRFDAVPREQAGMKQVELSLNTPVPYCHVEQLGNSTLVVGPGAHAVWTF
jgi:hypothetical protein